MSSVANVAFVAGQQLPIVSEPQAVGDHETSARWPDPIQHAGLVGLAGDVVRAIAPHSEADPAALLFQFLTCFGNAVGRGPHFQVEGDKHYPNIFMVLVGVSGKGRKGTSFGQVKRLFQAADPDWTSMINGANMSSGEGVIFHVRNATLKKEPVKNGGKVTGYEEVIVDHGVDDKRLFILESEFASVLKVIGREGNTLSPVIRSAWDTGDLGTLTKNCPVVATAAHISIVGHVTKTELLRRLDETETANGFGNRFLWVLSKRSQLLPEGGKLLESVIQELASRVKSALQFARGVGLVERDEEARELWRTIYSELAQGAPGLLGSITGRAEAYLMRLALILALLDESHIIRKRHLTAAYELWRYAFESAKYIFGNSLGDPLADELLALLRESPKGLTRTEIRDHFGRHKAKKNTSQALSTLQELGLVAVAKEKTAGRPIERWSACLVPDSDPETTPLQTTGSATSPELKLGLVQTSLAPPAEDATKATEATKSPDTTTAPAHSAVSSHRSLLSHQPDIAETSDEQLEFVV